MHYWFDNYFYEKPLKNEERKIYCIIITYKFEAHSNYGIIWNISNFESINVLKLCILELRTILYIIIISRKISWLVLRREHIIANNYLSSFFCFFFFFQFLLESTTSRTFRNMLSNLIDSG